jgi:hypothetical protein
VDRRRLVQQRLHDSPRLLHAVLPSEARAVTDQRRMQQHLVRSWARTALLCKLHVELDRGGSDPVGPVRVENQPDPRRRVELDDELVRLGRAVA